MVLKSPGDILISFNGFNIYYYGIIMAVACLVGVIVAYKLLKKIHPDEKSGYVWDFAAYLLLAGIIGARLYYCCLNPVKYFSHPLEIFNIREGGLSIHGALLMGVLALVGFSKMYKINSFKLLDVFACGTILAQSIGRWGNFFNSEAFGIPTNLPWKLYIPLAQRPDALASYKYFHPTFLYESILDLLVFFVLYMFLKFFGVKKPGLVFFLYLILYSVVRIFIENLRTDSVLNVSGVHIAQIISLILLIIGVFGIIFVIKFAKVKDNNF